MFRRAFGLLLALQLISSTPGQLHAQQGGPLQPPTTGGLPVLLQELQMLGHNKRVLMIGAHPDDEDTELLVLLTRHEGAESAYLSLTRGEGGQDLIGNELGEALGILRTEELLAARNVDGAQQYFTRAYDFGFSKTLDDTWAHWPKDSVLKDVVRIVRRFRPEIIVSVFSGTPRDGHGQHQAAGWAAQEAFRAAADPTRFPELKTEEGLDAWAPTKLYRAARFDPSGRTIEVDGGEVEKISGKTYHQLAMAARSLHRSQDMGQLQDFGPSIGGFALIAPAGRDVGTGWGAFWSGVDTLTGLSPEHLRAVADARAAAGRDPVAVGAALERAARDAPVNVLQLGLEGGALYQAHLARARRVVSRVFVDAIADRAWATPADRLVVTFTVRNGGPVPLPRTRWTVQGDVLDAPVCSEIPALAPGATARCTDTLTVSTASFSGNGPTSAYYLGRPRIGDLYSWRGVSALLRGRARESDPFTAVLAEVPERGDSRVEAASWSAPVTERIRDQSFGEIRRSVKVVPAVDVKLAPTNAVIRVAATGDARIVPVEVTVNAAGPFQGEVGLDLPAGWPRAGLVPIGVTIPGGTLHIPFRVPVPADAAPGTYSIAAYASFGGEARYDLGAFTVDYPHIRPQQYTKPAVAKLEVVDLTPPAIHHVAYVRGAADKVPEALAAAGLPVTILDSAALTSGDLHQYDVIVIGPRAYEVDSAVVRNSQRLIDYARDGGRVVVQYQQQIYLEGHFAPFALGGNSRITDERSPVTMLSAAPTQSAIAPVFNSPNQIGSSDWEGWIQERALYCPTTWGPEFHPLLAMNDPGEAPIRGCLIEGAVGRGSYVYTGISFFRELPAGVPGAYRLFFNLLGGRATP